MLDISLNEAQDLGGNLWGLDNINAPGSGTEAITFRELQVGATVAVIDTGVDGSSRIQWKNCGGYDFVDNDNDADDGNGHELVAGTIGGANDGTGITGVAPDASIMPIRVLGNDGYGYTSDII